MAFGINLLKKPAGLTQSQYQSERKVFLLSMLGFVVVIVASLSIFAWQLVTTRQLSGVENKIDSTNVQLKGLSDASLRQLYIKARLKIIEGFFKDKILSREALQQIFSIDIEGVSISSASFESEMMVSLRVAAEDVFAFDRVYEYFERDDLFFVEVTNRGASRSEEGDQGLSLNLSLPQGGQEE